ncbi:electron transfer flavoprotein subunit beta/FixA family protein [Herbiconiux sp. YIM B11900]|uniref:electron transfer flavoprotein subunit beta/FixA family protein n=1 Tax=Herbiconiux sp. YIM B11900 TaxID=3404131 RepID=UPI003F833465
MKIVVLVKEVPDTYGDRKLNLETGIADRDASERVLDEIGERAVEAAVAFADTTPGTEVVLLSVGPATVPASLRKGLAMGADSAIHVLDDELAGADLTLTAEVLAAALRAATFDVVVAGNVSTDGAGGVIPAMLAELLGVPNATFLSSWELTQESVSGKRGTDTGTATISAPLPAVVSITEAFPEPRFPNFKGILAAKKKPIQTWSLADLGVSADSAVPRSIMTSVEQTPARAAGVKVKDEGDAAAQLGEYLVQNRLV